MTLWIATFAGRISLVNNALPGIRGKLFIFVRYIPGTAAFREMEFHGICI